jgi:hypothetical protein
MPIYRGTQTAQAAGTSFKPDFKPNDRFGPRGGHVRIRAKNLTAANSTVAETVYIGNELLENRGVISADAGGNVDNFTPAVEGVGGPGDVIDVTFTTIGTAASTYNWVVEVENA